MFGRFISVLQGNQFNKLEQGQVITLWFTLWLFILFSAPRQVMGISSQSDDEEEFGMIQAE